MLKDSKLYVSQKSLIPRLFKKGTKEKLIKYDISVYDYKDFDIIEIYVAETIEITKSGQVSTRNNYNWIYSIKNTPKGPLLANIRKRDIGNTKTIKESFCTNYGYWLASAANESNLGLIKSISEDKGSIDNQIQLIMVLRKYGSNIKYLGRSWDDMYFDDQGNSKYTFSCIGQNDSIIYITTLVKYEIVNRTDSVNIPLKLKNFKYSVNLLFKAPLKGKTISDFIIKGWKLFDSTDGDINGDNLKDRAVIIEQDNGWEQHHYDEGNNIPVPERLLLIALKQKDGTYKLAAQSYRIIKRANEGGAFGDPYNGMSINKKVLTISFYGGSREKWGEDYSIELINNGFYLIGYSYYSIDGATFDEFTRYYNLLTGKLVITESSNGKETKKETLNISKKSIIKLDNFDSGYAGELGEQIDNSIY